MAVSPQNRTLAILILAALFLFFFGAGQSYRSDEVWSIQAANLPVPDLLHYMALNDTHPPLHAWLLHWWLAMFGESEWATRSLSILLCLGAAAFVFATAREQWGMRAGLLALAVFVTSPIATVAAQMTRTYGLLIFASAASTYGFFRLLRDPRPSISWALFIAANAVGSLAHIWFFFLLFAQGVVYIAARRSRGLGWMALAAVVSLLPYSILWLPNLTRQFGTSKDAISWVDPPAATDLVSTAFFFGGLFTLAAPFVWARWRRQSSVSRISLALTILVLAVPFALSFWKPIYAQRFTVAALPAFALAVGSLAPRRESNYGLETGLAIASCSLAVVLGFYTSACNARDAAAYLAQHTKPGDTVVFTSLSRLPVDYYWNKLQPARRVGERSFPAEIDTHPGFEGPIHTPAQRPRLTREAIQVADAPAAKRIFFLHGFHPRTDALLKDTLQKRFTPLDSLNLSCDAMGSYFQYISAYSCVTPGLAQVK